MRSSRVYMLIICVLLLFSSLKLVSAQDYGLPNILSELTSNPTVTIVFIVHIAIGFGLGYFTMKALKYILAILALLIVGLLLNIWQFGSLRGFFERLGMDWTKIISITQSVFTVLGVLSVLPIGIGFCLGIIAGVLKK
ncbi:MAG: hypothetical protein RMJ07_00505 [Nitrososphaerota archaeon]|nr:hypothetical protein [Candidatus Bathyarchaeota archaeon]MDW8048154.1 hypothetical protein [Nitrososphaerota archaeon]